MINYPSSAKPIFIKSPNTAAIITSLATGRFSAIFKKISEDADLEIYLKKWMEDKISAEVSAVVSIKNPSILSKTDCNALLNLRNEDIVCELKERAPTLYLALYSAVNSQKRRNMISEGHSDDKSPTSLAMALSILMRRRNPTLTALSYRVSMVLHHSGAKKKVCVYFLMVQREVIWFTQ